MMENKQTKNATTQVLSDAKQIKVSLQRQSIFCKYHTKEEQNKKVLAFKCTPVFYSEKVEVVF